MYNIWKIEARFYFINDNSKKIENVFRKTVYIENVIISIRTYTILSNI